MSNDVQFDIELFRELNREYRDKRLVPAPRAMDPDALLKQARRRTKFLQQKIGVRGLRLLEIGAGRGHLCRVAHESYDADVIGVDINVYETWDEISSSEGVSLQTIDVTVDDISLLGTFDRIVSFAVFEHVERPYEGLQAMFDLLKPGGVAYMSANLYRGPKASHRYRQVFFPFPHLLFSDDVFAEFYRPTKWEHTAPAWVNKLTAAQYREKLRDIGFVVEEQWVDETPLDMNFYDRFEHVLGRYPREDLETDFIHLVLRRPDKRSTAVAVRRVAERRRSGANAASDVLSKLGRRGRSIICRLNRH
jgi:cyclopropane fatty-acyl-phospholipid synthase-like methyltransferase